MNTYQTEIQIQINNVQIKRIYIFEGLFSRLYDNVQVIVRRTDL